MPNLIVEYKKRRNSASIPVHHDGLCFFDGHYGSIIAMTSLSCRSFMTCCECAEGDRLKANVIVELFCPGYSGNFCLMGHSHVDPSTDLFAHVNKFGDYQPFYANNNRDLELWLWRCCMTTVKVAGFRSDEMNEDFRTIEHMAWMAIRHPSIYDAYYMAYEAFLLSRKYLLFN